MATYIITTSNWNNPSFWSAINHGSSGSHTMDFSGLPSNFSVDFWPAGNRILISDGATNFIIGDADFGGTPDVSLGGSTQLDYFETVVGSDGQDMLDGGSGNDTIYGGDGIDTINGNGGDDVIDGGDRTDLVYGGAGNDLITDSGGASSDDTIYGQSGNDTISGGLREDYLDGGDDADTFLIEDSFGNDTIVGGEGGTDSDQIDVSAVTSGVTVSYTDVEEGTITDGADTITFSEIEDITLTNNADSVDASAVTVSISLDGEDGNDTLRGGDGADTIRMGEGDDIAYGGEGADEFYTEVGNDTIYGEGGNDSVYGWYVDSDLYIDGGAGDDSIFGSGNDTILGGIGNDWIDASEGSDSVDGGDGDDLIDGGDGGDTLYGGDGADVIEAGEEGSGGDDDLIYGGVGNDTITSAETNTGSNDTIFGEDGDDVISVTGGRNNLLDGGIGNDTITGGTGTDTIDGGAGDDSLSGGDARDYFILSTGSDTVDGGDGYDSFDTSLATTGIKVTWTDGESGTVQMGADTTTFTNIGYFESQTGITGYGGTDDFYDASGSTSGGIQIQDYLGGADTVIGSDFDDFMDFYGYYDQSVDGLNVDLGGGNDFIGIEEDDNVSGSATVLGGTGNDYIYTYGRGLNVEVDGGSGDDSIYGNNGEMTVRGGTGNDDIVTDDQDDIIIIEDGFGNDTIIAGENDEISGDLLDFSEMTTSGVNVTYSGNDAATATDGTDTLNFAEVERLELTGQNDSVDGSVTTSALNVAGGLGDDTLTGGTGGDTLAGGDGDDYIDGGAGDDFLTTGLGQDTLMGGEGNDTLMNSDGDDSLDGGAGNDSIVATGGEDTLRGGAGDDTMDGGDDADTFIIEGGFGNDVITGGEGTTDPGDEDYDTIDLSAMTGPVTVTYGSDNESGTITDGTDTITFSEIEKIITTDQADSVDASDVFDGVFGDNPGIDIETRGGNDTIVSGWGGDTIDGGTGNDSIDGDYGDDSLVGGGGQDTLIGSSGNDTLEGGADNDTLDGGIEGDVLRGGTGSDVLLGQSGDDSLEGGDGNDLLFGHSDDDTLSGGTGDDTIDGGSGNDSLTGGAGDDTFVYDTSDGNDTITDFNFGNTGALDDGDNTNNDFIDLSGFYDHISELYADQADDGILNQSNATDTRGNAVDYSDNSQFSGGSIEMQGASADESSFTEENTGVVCFTAGTAIRTPRGDVLIEDLRVGDLVNTMDNGPQAIRWIGQREIGSQALAASPNLRPVLVPKGVLGAERDLLVSRQHTLMVERDYLARAAHLIDVSGLPVRIANGKLQVTYIHLMFDAHEIIFAENVPAESFYPGPMALEMLDDATSRNFFGTFPDLHGVNAKGQNVTELFGATARDILTRRDLMQSE